MRLRPVEHWGKVLQLLSPIGSGYLWDHSLRYWRMLEFGPIHSQLSPRERETLWGVHDGPWGSFNQFGQQVYVWCVTSQLDSIVNKNVQAYAFKELQQKTGISAQRCGWPERKFDLV